MSIYEYIRVYMNIYRRTHPFEDSLDKTFVRRDPKPAWVPLISAGLRARFLENARKNSLGTAKRSKKLFRDG